MAWEDLAGEVAELCGYGSVLDCFEGCRKRGSWLAATRPRKTAAELVDTRAARIRRATVVRETRKKAETDFRNHRRAIARASQARYYADPANAERNRVACRERARRRAAARRQSSQASPSP